MANQGAAVEAGQCIRVSWPVAETTGEGHTVSKRKAEVLAVEKSKKVKHGSCWKYTLRFSDDNAIEKTRLTHLKFKKIESLQRSGDGDEKPKKKSKKDDSTKTASGSKKSSASASSTPSIADLQSTVMKRPGKCDWIIPPHKYICAPMVGASELAFRLLCRRYGCPMAYTPMISSTRFAQDEEYRKGEFQTNAQDRPLVAHFSANDPAHLLASAKLVEKHCDAIDLNLGCPQRVAFVGHYGSFLLDQKDRPLVLSIVKSLADNITIPVFVKIRLLDSVAETIELCQQLVQAGAALIAIHARYRVNLAKRDGPGARDGAAMLDQVAEVRKAVPDVVLITNGNVREHEDIQINLDSTGADGVMSAEGLLDNPAIFCPESGPAPDKLALALEYLAIVDSLPAHQPTKMKSVVFHVRRMCRDELNTYQLMEECVASTTVDQVRGFVRQCMQHRDKGDYEHDPMKAIKARKALERRKAEEGKRKAYEGRMTRKAKREGKDPNFYLIQGAEVPTVEGLAILKALGKEKAFVIWKEKHSQHCYEYHFGENQCSRDRTCAFMHTDPSFVANDAEVFG